MTPAFGTSNVLAADERLLESYDALLDDHHARMVAISGILLYYAIHLLPPHHKARAGMHPQLEPPRSHEHGRVKVCGR